MKKIMVLLLVFSLSGCIFTNNDQEDKAEVELVLKELEKSTVEYEVNDEIRNIIEFQKINQVQVIDGYMFISISDSLNAGSLVVYDEELNEVVVLDEDRNYYVLPFLYDGYFIIDFSNFSSSDYRLMDKDGTIVEDVSLKYLFPLYFGDDFQVFVHKRIINSENVLEVVKIDEDGITILFSETTNHVFFNAYLLDDFSVLIWANNAVKRAHLDGTIETIMEESTHGYYQLGFVHNGYTITHDGNTYLYNLDNEVIDNWAYGSLQSQQLYDEYEVLEYNGGYILLKDTEVVLESEDIPYMEYELNQGILRYRYRDNNKDLGYVIEAINEDELVFSIEVDSKPLIHIDDHLLYVGLEDNGVYNYRVYNETGQEVDTFSLQEQLLVASDDGYIVNSCLQQFDQAIPCMSMVNNQGMEVWQIPDTFIDYNNFTKINDDLFYMDIESLCHPLLFVWEGCVTTFFDGDGNIVFSSLEDYTDFQVTDVSNEFIYVKASYEVEMMNGIEETKILVFDFNLNLVEEYKTLGIIYFIGDFYYLADEKIVHFSYIKE